MNHATSSRARSRGASAGWAYRHLIPVSALLVMGVGCGGEPSANQNDDNLQNQNTAGTVSAGAGTGGGVAGMNASPPDGNAGTTAEAGTTGGEAGAGAEGAAGSDTTGGGAGAAGSGDAGQGGEGGSGEAGSGGEEEPWPADCEETYTLTAHASGDPDAKYMVPAGTEEHPQFFFDSPWNGEEVQAVAFRDVTDNAKVLHHWILYGEDDSVAGEKFIVGWAPGKNQRPLPDNVGMFLPSGRLRLDMHYYNLGGDSAEPDASGVEACIIRNPENFREHTAGIIGLGDFLLSIPPSQEKEETSTCTAEVTGESVTFLSVSPHMHELGTHAYLGLNGTPLHDAPFSFEEQRVYSLDAQIRNGDQLTTTCTYQNTTNQTVSFGQDTGDEMCFNFVLYYPLGNLNCGFAL